MTKTINISIKDADLERIDRYCACHNLTRSKYFLQCVLQSLDVEEMANNTLLLYHLLDKYAKTGKLSKQEIKTLNSMSELLATIKGVLMQNKGVSEWQIENRKVIQWFHGPKVCPKIG